MRYFKGLSNGVPLKYNVLDFIMIIGFAIFHSYSLRLYSSIVNKNVQTDYMRFLLLILGYTVAWGIVEYIGDFTSYMSNTYIENSVFHYYIDKLYSVKPSVLKSMSTGYISGLVQKLVSRQVETRMYIIESLFIDIVYLVVSCAVLAKYSLSACFILVAIYIAGNAVRYVITKFISDKRVKELVELEGDRDRQFIDVTVNINTVQKMQAIEYIDTKLHDARDSVVSKAKKLALIDESGFIFVKYLASMFFPIMMCIIYIQCGVSGKPDLEYVAYTASLGVSFPHNARALAKALQLFNQYKNSFNKLESIISCENLRKPLYSGEFTCVEIKDVDYSYVENNKALRVVIPKFSLRRGDFVCIHGESGQGKTTLLHILSNEIETDNVVINGVESTKASRLDCVFIAQDTEMFDMSLRDNLTLGRDISDARLLYLLERVGMKDWYDSQKDGLNTILGERGVFVSTGQRQRLNIIRGLLISDKEVYLLDEPTSNVDTETEERIIALINEELAGKTVVIVSHREPIMRICSRHYIFEDGVLREE